MELYLPTQNSEALNISGYSCNLWLKSNRPLSIPKYRIRYECEP
jgi:hypothetical protein